MCVCVRLVLSHINRAKYSVWERHKRQKETGRWEKLYKELRDLYLSLNNVKAIKSRTNKWAREGGTRGEEGRSTYNSVRKKWTTGNTLKPSHSRRQDTIKIILQRLSPSVGFLSTSTTREVLWLPFAILADGLGESEVSVSTLGEWGTSQDPHNSCHLLTPHFFCTILYTLVSGRWSLPIYFLPT